MSVLILSRELSILVRVFLMRSAVNLADGFWYQHSFMSLAMEVKVWKWIRRNKSICTSLVNIISSQLFYSWIWGYAFRNHSLNFTYWVWKPSVWDVGPLLVHTHDLLHILKTGITWDDVVKRWLVVFYNAYKQSRAEETRIHFQGHLKLSVKYKLCWQMTNIKHI